ncbi:MAG: type II toxin-antitoxin system RelE/ParE family toxin [Candidatus Riflebacteria bacterium]|nr:type II toxin-antitoxin system RelE/ParE family toxin [Candidatus Riflebacteria bacterium]
MKPEVVVELTKAAERDLKALWKVSEEVVEHLKVLKTEPEKGHPLTGSLQGVRSLDFALKGSGQYRAAYFYIFKNSKVTVFMVGPHENFYKQAQKRVAQVKDLMTQAREEQKEKAKKK